MIIHPDQLYFDRRQGIDPTQPHDVLLGARWIDRDVDTEWLVRVEPNEHGFLIEQPPR